VPGPSEYLKLVIPSYIRRGILPAVAKGLGEADQAAQARQA